MTEVFLVINSGSSSIKFNLTTCLFSKPTIAYCLEKGLESLGYSCNE